MSEISRSELQVALAELELTMERRLGAIEGDVREIKMQMVRREGPIMEEIRKFETTVNEIRRTTDECNRRMGKLLSPAEMRELARNEIAAAGAGTRTTVDYGIRIIMFAISLGTLIFVAKGVS